MDRTELEKLKSNWAQKMDFNLLAVAGTEAYAQELSQFERETRYAAWEAEYLRERDITIAEHQAQNLIFNTTEVSAESLKRVKVPGGWLYIHSVMAKGIPGKDTKLNPNAPLAVQSATQFIPDTEERKLSGAQYLDHVLSTFFSGDFSKLKEYIHSSPNLSAFKARFSFAGTDPDEVEQHMEALEQVWKNYWGFKYAVRAKNSGKA